MLDNIRYNIPLAIGALLCAFLAIGVLTFAGPCVHADGSQAACAQAGHAVLAASVVSFVLALAALMLRNRTITSVLALLGAAGAVFAAMAPANVFPLCMMQTMHCWAVMRPFALVVGLLAAVLLIAGAAKARRSR